MHGIDDFSFPDGQDFDSLGNAVAVVGNRALIGAPLDKNGLSDKGSVYAFEKVQGQWQFVQKLTQGNSGATGRSFGNSVRMSGETAVVGADGMAVVFVHRNGAWTEQARLTPSGVGHSESVGYAPSISGDVIVLGDAYGSCDGAQAYGCAYIFRRTGDVWGEEARVRASQPRVNMGFGISTAVSGDTVIVGAPDDGIPGGSGTGSAYVYVRSGSAWTEAQRLLRSNPTNFDSFGTSVALEGAVAAIGAPTGSGAGGVPLPGTVLIFRRDATGWSETQQIVAAGQPFAGRFGSQVALLNSRVVVGAPSAERAYLFGHVAGSFVQQCEILPNAGEPGGRFGSSVAVSDEELVAGVPSPQSQQGLHSGAAYFASVSGTSCSATQRVTSGLAGLTENFGSSMALSGDLAVVGTLNLGDTGKAYIFRRGSTGWLPEAILQSDQPGDEFGRTVAISQDQILVAAPARNNSFGARAGSVFAYRRVGGTWQIHREIVATDGSPHAFFGLRLSTSNDWLAVGTPFDDIGGAESVGSVRIFQYSSGEWSQRARLLAPVVAAFDYFGEAIELRDSDLAVGAPGTGLNPNDFRGSVFMFARQDDVWQLRSTLVPSSDRNAAFGVSLGFETDQLLIGAPFEAVQGVQNAGAAYAFRRAAGNWTLERKLVSTVPSITSFGRSVVLEGAYAAIGATESRNSMTSGTVDVLGAGNQWLVLDRLRSPEPFGTGSFGAGLVADGGVLLVSSASEYAESIYSNPGDGAVYSFDLGPGASTLFGDGFESAAP